jgi:hypothetical protein
MAAVRTATAANRRLTILPHHHSTHTETRDKRETRERERRKRGEREGIENAAEPPRPAAVAIKYYQFHLVSS